MGSLFKLHRLRFKMLSLLLLLAPLAMAATMGSNKGRESRHFWGQNMTVPRSFQNMGSINIAGVGDVYVVTQDPSTVQMVDNGFRLVGGGRVYLAQEAANDFSNPYIYWQAPLLGNHISYTVDVSNVGCHCNSAFYFVQMPGYDSSQNVIAGPGGDYYCDANHVNDNWCPEYDTWEGNRRPSTCSFTPAIMWLPTTIPTVTEVAVEQMPVMASLDNTDRAELLTPTSPLLSHTPRCAGQMGSWRPQTRG